MAQKIYTKIPVELRGRLDDFVELHRIMIKGVLEAAIDLAFRKTVRFTSLLQARRPRKKGRRHGDKVDRYLPLGSVISDDCYRRLEDLAKNRNMADVIEVALDMLLGQVHPEAVRRQVHDAALRKPFEAKDAKEGLKLPEISAGLPRASLRMISDNSIVLLDRYIVLYGLIGKQREAFSRASEDCWHLLQKIKTKSMAGVITTTEFMLLAEYSESMQKDCASECRTKLLQLCNSMVTVIPIQQGDVEAALKDATVAPISEKAQIAAFYRRFGTHPGIVVATGSDRFDWFNEQLVHKPKDLGYELPPHIEKPDPVPGPPELRIPPSERTEKDELRLIEYLKKQYGKR